MPSDPTPTAAPAPQSPPAKRGFGTCPCPHCGEEDVNVALCVTDAGNGEVFRCLSCDEWISPEDVREKLAEWRRWAQRWEALLALYESLPVLEE